MMTMSSRLSVGAKRVDIGEKYPSVDRTINHERCDNSIVAQAATKLIVFQCP